MDNTETHKNIYKKSNIPKYKIRIRYINLTCKCGWKCKIKEERKKKLIWKLHKRRCISSGKNVLNTYTQISPHMN